MSLCPYDKKTTCACLERIDAQAFACNKCQKYIDSTENTDNDPFDGAKAVGCLLVGIGILLIIFYIGYCMVIKNRPV